MSSLPASIFKLRKILSRTPAFSEKGAERFLEWWWKKKIEDKKIFQEEWKKFSEIGYCHKCFCFSSKELCLFCNNQKRNNQILCVITSPFTVDLIEKDTNYDGHYFNLGREVGETRNIEAVKELKERINFLNELITKNKVREIIMATDFTAKGEATALFVRESLKETGVRISRLARGFHLGDMINYTDPITVQKAFEKRENMD